MSIILSLIVFSILVLIHEFGHFLLAKKNGIGVTEFSLGMGPRLFSFVKGETRYCIKLIPFGGSCMMLGEDEDNDSEKAFNKKSVWARISVIAAGPIFNFILALVLSMVIIGFEGYDRCEVVEVKDGSGAEESGLKPGDVITEFDGENIVISRDLWLYEFMYDTTEKPINIKYTRAGKEYKTTISPFVKYSMGISYQGTSTECKVLDITKNSAAQKEGIKKEDIIVGIKGNKITSGEELTKYLKDNPLTKEEFEIEVNRDGEKLQFNLIPKEVYTTGFGYSMGREKTGAIGTIRYSFTELRYNIESTVKSFVMLFNGKVTTDDVSGPVGIVNIVGDTYKESKSDGPYYVFLNIAFLIVLFSVNLGVLNLLPFPALDGGRLVFLLIEAVRGKPVAREKEAVVHFVGMILLMVLMVLVLFNDLSKIF